MLTGKSQVHDKLPMVNQGPEDTSRTPLGLERSCIRELHIQLYILGFLTEMYR